MEIRARRVFVADARGNDQYLRATWHPETAVVVLSHWDGDVCVASTPVRLTELSTLIELLVAALQDAATRSLEGPSMPDPPHPRWTALLFERLRGRVPPKLAQVVALRHASTAGDHRADHGR